MTNLKEISLTKNEIAILRGARDNDFMDCFSPELGASSWTFAVISASGLKPTIARGVISSLVQKGLVSADGVDVPVNDRCFSIQEDYREQLLKIIEEGNG